MVDQRDRRPKARYVIFGSGILAWAFALALTRDVDYARLFGFLPRSVARIVCAPFEAPLVPFCLALTGGLGMVMLVSEAPSRLKVYGSLLAFTAPMYAAARLLATA